MAVTLIQNAALLITLSVLYGIIKWYKPQNNLSTKLITGAWFGLVAVAAMLMPYQYHPGAIYDGRSVVLTLAGFWVGSYAAVVSALIAGVYRFFLGGVGVWAGLTTILLCSLSGLFFRYILRNRLFKVNVAAFWGIGLVSHVLMLFSQLLIPEGRGLLILQKIWLPVLLIFPVAFAIIATLVRLIDRYIANLKKLKEAEILYRTTIMSIGDGVICTDKSGRISQMNPVAVQLTGWEFSEAAGKPLNEVFRIINEDNRLEVESPFEKVMRSGTVVGLANHTLLIAKSGKEIPVADSGAPIKDINNKVVGVVLVFRDQTEEREQQNKLRRSESLYRQREFWLSQSQRIGKIGTYDLDILNNRWTSSDVLDEIFGITPDDPHTVECWYGIVHPQQQQEMMDYFLKTVIRDRTPFNKEYRIVRKNDGTERWVIGHGELMYNESGQAVKMFGTIQDITERKRYEEQLIESEERFRKSILLAPVPVIVFDEDLNIMNLSQGWTNFSGYTLEDIPTVKIWTQKAYGDYASEVDQQVAYLFTEDKIVRSGEYEIKTKTGEKRIWSFYSTPIGRFRNGKKIMLSIAADITDIRKMQVDLEESELAYRKLFENHSAVKFLIDPDSGQIVKANKAAENFYGWSMDELQQMNINQINTLTPRQIKKAMDAARAENKIYFEFKHRLANGEVRDVEVFSSRIDYKGKVMLHSIVHDVTEKKRLFNELIVAKELAEESERLKTAFLANMSHEIRTPLNGILGFTGLLAEDDNLSKEIKNEYASVINKSAEGLLKIINDILDISRLETGRINFMKKHFDVCKMLSTINTIFKRRMAESAKNGVVLKLIVPEQPVYLHTDEDRLIQIFSNLLDNATRFTNAGTIQFGVVVSDNGTAELFVSDTGIGIRREKQQIVFDRFSQADDQTMRSYGGTGLGLAIVKKLVEIMGSEIFLESEPGKGTRFWFHLPCTKYAEGYSQTNLEEINA